MINKFMYVIAAFCGLPSCNNDTNTIVNTVSTVPEKLVAAAENSIACFAAANKKDTITLHIAVNGNSVTGDLMYHIFQKDRNTGIIHGEMKGDTLRAEYTFMSEGINSAREVIFLKKGNDLVEGFGEMEEKNGKMVFKNRSAINYDSKTILLKVNCVK